MTRHQFRLDKLLGDRGLGSRRTIQALIRQGRITVHGAPVSKPNLRVSVDSPITFDGAPVHPLPMVIAWHKPLGVHSTYRDPWGRLGLDEVLPTEWRSHFHPIGRLDAETSGLLLFGRYGRLTQWLLHPRRAIERTYTALVEGSLSDGALTHLKEGVQTSEGTFCADVISAEGERIELVVRQGRHRMVRRMLANVGHPVIELHRERYGPIALGDLKPNDARAAHTDEIEWLETEGAPLPKH